jgi:cytochrome c
MTGSRFLPVPLVVAAGFLLAMPISAAETLLVDEGRHALDTRCSRCHAIGAEGQSPHAEAPPFRELMRRYPPESLAEALAEGIVSGHPDMPEYVLSPSEIEAVMAYLHTLSQP